MRAALIFAFVLAGTAHAQTADEAAAKTEFETGRALYGRGQYAEALPHLRRAYALSGKRPSTIRALAQCEGALGSYDDAIRLLREYLATNPAKEDRDAAEALIRELEEGRPTVVAEHPREADSLWDPPSRSEPGIGAADDSAIVAPPPVEDDSLLASPWFWILTGAVVVLGGTGLAIAMSSGTEHGPPFGGSTGIVLGR